MVSRLFVGAVVRRDDEVLLVRQSPGHPIEGQWTVPWGATEDEETLAEAAVRETFEEGGIVARVDGLLGIQQLPDPQLGSIGIAILCTHVRGEPRSQARETDAAQYYSLTTLDALTEPVEPWSDWLVRKIFVGDFNVSCADVSGPFQPSESYL